MYTLFKFIGCYMAQHLFFIAINKFLGVSVDVLPKSTQKLNYGVVCQAVSQRRFF